MTFDTYIQSVADLLDRVDSENYSYIVRAPEADITSIKGSFRIAEQAELIFADVNYQTDTCVLLKNRRGVHGTVGLSMLCILISEAIERRTEIDKILQ